MKVLDQKSVDIITDVLGTGTALIASLIANGLLITFSVIFLLAGRNSHHGTLGLYKDIETAIRRYIVTKFVISAINGALVWLILTCWGCEWPLFSGC